MSRDERSLRSLVRSPRRTCVRRTYRPLPTYTRLAGERPARPLRSFAPPGSPFGTTLALARLRPPVGALLGFCRPPELSPPRFRVRSLAAPHAGGKAPYYARLQAPRSVALATVVFRRGRSNDCHGCTPRPELRP